MLIVFYLLDAVRLVLTKDGVIMNIRDYMCELYAIATAAAAASSIKVTKRVQPSDCDTFRISHSKGNRCKFRTGSSL